MKKCKTCGENKELALFYKDRKKNDGCRNVCKECDKKHRIAYYSLNKKEEANRYKKYAQKNSEKIAKKKKETREKNFAKVQEYSKDYYAKNREARLKKNADWYKKNSKNEDVIAWIRSKSSKRRAAKINAVVPWTDDKEIKKVYAKAREMTKMSGIKYEVDHVIPLQGKMVCGLHVMDNLEIITKEKNREKRNYFHYDA